MRVELAASEEEEKGEKATNHTHILVTEAPLLSPAAFVTATVVSAHNFS